MKKAQKIWIRRSYEYNNKSWINNNVMSIMRKRSFSYVSIGYNSLPLYMLKNSKNFALERVETTKDENC